MSSGNIRRQLGPARKRLKDRMNDMNIAMQENDVGKIKTIRVKLKANMEFHEKLTQQLCGLSGLPEDEQKIVEIEIDSCTELNMDSQEVIYSADEILQEGASSDSKHNVQMQMMLHFPMLVSIMWALFSSRTILKGADGRIGFACSPA